MPAFSAVLDTSVIFPAILNDTLLCCAEYMLYSPLWSDRILHELRESRRRTYPHRDHSRVDSRILSMRHAFPSATVTAWARVAAEIAPELPDPDDAHVIAAALVGGAELIVTNNLKDFPRETLALWGLTALSADDFLVGLWTTDPLLVSQALRTQLARLRNPPLSPEEFCDKLARTVPEFSVLVRGAFIA